MRGRTLSAKRSVIVMDTRLSSEWKIKEHRRKNNNNNNRNCIMLYVSSSSTGARQCGLLEINYRNESTVVVRLRHCRRDSVTTGYGTRGMRFLDHHAVATAGLPVEEAGNQQLPLAGRQANEYDFAMS